ncbi:histidinol-phosphate transaminase [Salinirubellus sp. GCM10025818]|uniref:histidinol-phosphate transaminase n=1 Tax=Salinirubellus TaxID=2162630 RepID=UPI0030D25D61
MRPRDLSDHAVYEAGRGIEEVARELGFEPGELVKLSSNENPLGPSPRAVEAIREAAPSVNTYPKADHADLIARLADRHGVEPEQVWLASGGDGALDYLHRALLEPGDGVLVPDPGFAYYPMSARFHHGTVSPYALSREDDFAQTAEGILEDYDGERVVHVTSPHNPTGSEMSGEEVEALAEATDGETLVLVDEAYVEFSDDPGKVDLVRERDDVAVLRTFSKVYGLAGLRLGYILVPEAWGDAYARVNTPFAVNKPALRAGIAALDDDEHLERTVETARWSRSYMHEHLDAPTWPSGGNFVLADVDDGGAVFEACKERGVIVRDTSSFGLPDCVRITAGTREGTRRAVEVMNEVTGERR